MTNDIEIFRHYQNLTTSYSYKFKEKLPHPLNSISFMNGGRQKGSRLPKRIKSESDEEEEERECNWAKGFDGAGLIGYMEITEPAKVEKLDVSAEEREEEKGERKTVGGFKIPTWAHVTPMALEKRRRRPSPSRLGSFGSNLPNEDADEVEEEDELAETQEEEEDELETDFLVGGLSTRSSRESNSKRSSDEQEPTQAQVESQQEQPRSNSPFTPSQILAAASASTSTSLPSTPLPRSSKRKNHHQEQDEFETPYATPSGYSTPRATPGSGKSDKTLKNGSSGSGREGSTGKRMKSNSQSSEMDVAHGPAEAEGEKSPSQGRSRRDFGGRG
jgi:hypothetical protein